MGLSTIPQVETGHKGLSLTALNRIAEELQISFGGLGYLCSVSQSSEDTDLMHAQSRLALRVFARKDSLAIAKVKVEFPWLYQAPGTKTEGSGKEIPALDAV